jgi:hypothetical protein
MFQYTMGGGGGFLATGRRVFFKYLFVGSGDGPEAGNLLDPDPSKRLEYDHC